jgi:integrase/recombinase XerD
VKQAKLLTQHERKRLAAVIDSKRYSTRNHTAVALSFYAGLRACEIAALVVSDVFDNTGAVRDTIHLRAAQTKGNEAATILINKRLTQKLHKYAVQYPNHIQQRTAALIFSAKGSGFSAQTIVNLFQNLFKAAAIDGASSHSGRRQFVTELADKGINARVIQALARHKHLNTTMRYIDLNENKLRNAIELVDY